MEKLTLEHIAAQLPYKMIGKSSGGRLYYLDTFSSMRGDGIENREIGTFINEQFKPILYPISWLRTDEGFDKYLELCDELEVTSCEYLLEAIEKGSYYTIDIKKYNILEKWMYSNHFDWKNNLIQKGLAIDVNTLTTNPYN